MRQLTLLPLAAPGGLDSIARAVAAESMRNVLAFAKPETCLALTEDPAMAALAEEHGIRAAKAPVGRGEDLIRLLPEARRQLRGFAQAAGDKATEVLIVNPLNPLLSARRLRDAVRVFRQAPETPLVSVRVCRNHPCQFRRYLRLVQLDALHLLDHEWTPGRESGTDSTPDVLASRSFSPHRQERHLFQSPPGTLFSCRDGRPLAAPEHGLAALFQSDGLARLIFTPSPQVQGLPEQHGARRGDFRLAGLMGHLRNALALFENTGTGARRLYFARNSPFRPELVLRFIPFSPSQTFWDQTVDVSVTSPALPPLPLAVKPPPEAVGYIVCVYEEASNGGDYETQEIFAPPLAPWGVLGEKVFNAASGREIHGRQAFPTVARTDGSLAVLPLPLALEGSWLAENARAYILPDKESLIVTDQIEYLRLLAQRQAEETRTQTP